jgi:nucleotide-binding universal stress UspA family protein
MKILIGYDGSEGAEAALDDLMRAGLPDFAKARIVTVAELWLPPPPPSSLEIIEEAREVHVPSDLKRVYAKDSAAAHAALALAQRACERVQANFPRWDVTAEAACGSPAWELVLVADRWKPDLIVVGSHGRTAVGRFVLGSVSQRVLTEARCSVRVARGRLDEPNSPVRIVVGLDGSPGSEAAVRVVAARNWPSGSEIELVVVDDPFVSPLIGELIPPLAKSIEEENKEEVAWSVEIASKATSFFVKQDIKVMHVLRNGDPKRELPHAAEEWAADCIFVGSTGFSNRFARFILGSVSAAVAARAHCSVEVVRGHTDQYQ